MNIVKSTKTYLLVILGIVLGITFFISIAFASSNTHSGDFEKDNSEYFSITDGSQSGLDITGDLTLEAWIKPETLPASASGQAYVIAGKWDNTGSKEGYMMRLYEGEYLELALHSGSNNDQISSAYTFVTDTWVHVATTWDASAKEFKFYADGVLLETKYGSNSSIQNNSADFRIGAREHSGSANDFFDGLVDEVRVWSDVRTATEISDNKDAELVGNEANLVGYWQLNNGATDLTSNGNDLTNNNTVTYTTDSAFSGSAFLSKTRKPSDESVTSSTTMQDDDNFSINLAADTDYVIDGTLFVESSNNKPDIKIAFDIPTGATMDIAYIAASTDGRYSAEILETDQGESDTIPIVGGSPLPIFIHGTVEMGSTAGTIDLEWAQDTSNANATTIKEGSYLRAEEI